MKIIMNKTTLLLLLLLLLPFSASANDNVSIEIFLNSMSEYYVGVDGGSLQPCLSGMCNITVDRNITTGANISDDDIRKIALQTAAELRTVKFATDSLNKSETWAIMNDVAEKSFASYRDFGLVTMIPQQSDFNNLSVKLAVEEGKVAKLKADAGGYTAKIQAKDVQIDLLKRKVSEYGFMMIMFLFGFLWFMLPQTAVFQQWKDKMRMQ